MSHEEIAAGHPLHRAIAFTSPDETEEAMRDYGVNQKVRQLGKGKFRFDLAVRSTEQADLFSGRFNQAVSITLEPAVGTVRFLLPWSANGQYLASGSNVGGGLVVLPSGSGTDIVTQDLAGADAIAIPEARFIAMTAALCPTAKSDWRDPMALTKVDAAKLRAIRKLMHHVMAHLETDPHPEHVSTLVAAAVAFVGHASRNSQPQRFTVNGARRGVARRTQEFIEAHYREAVRIEDLCRVTGVGVRTLQRCFREYFDLTIGEYLKAVRLDATRRELAAAHPSQDSVTAIALRHGFTHLGRFSLEFRARFGRSPSEILAN